MPGVEELIPSSALAAFELFVSIGTLSCIAVLQLTLCEDIGVIRADKIVRRILYRKLLIDANTARK